MCNEMEKNAFN